jgi:ABC-type dipeptide/oligopeptide/nickel transport system ATPase component
MEHGKGELMAQLCEDLAVMYMGHVMDYANTEDINPEPLHHYTNGLLRSHGKGLMKRMPIFVVLFTVSVQKNYIPRGDRIEQFSMPLRRWSRITMVHAATPREGGESLSYRRTEH